MSHVILMSSSHVTKYSLTLIAQLLYDLMYKYPDKIYIQILWSNIVSYSSVNVLHHSELITLFQNKVQYSKRIVTIQCSIKSNKANKSALICRIAKRLNTWCGAFLADCIRKESEFEFGPTISEQQEIVQDYVQMKKLNLSLLMAILVLIRQHKTTPWEWNNGLCIYECLNCQMRAYHKGSELLYINYY